MLRPEQCYVGFLSFDEPHHTPLFISMLYRGLLRHNATEPSAILSEVPNQALGSLDR